MREIKFRAWDKKEKKMYFFDFRSLVGGDDGSVSIDENMFGKDIDDKNLIFQQFTGLKDKKGKEIFEGDTVEGNGKTMNIKYNFGYSVINYANYIFPDGEIEVIGNIYENPSI
jgi:uncharacterized phage protein (TIGR01671 family)